MTDLQTGATADGIAASSCSTTANSARRNFLTHAGRMLAVGGLAAIAACGGSEESPLPPSSTPTPSPSGTTTPTITPVTDSDMMILMLQLHYLQAEFFARAVLGTPLPATMVNGSGTMGDVEGARQVTFADPLLRDMMREIAVEKIDQVVRLRAVLGTATPARPAINIGVDDAGVFTKYGRDSNDVPAATGGAARGTYDVYVNQERFLLGAFLLEDSVIAAWRGISGLMVNAANIDVAAGLLGASAQHVGLVRSQLYLRGAVTGSTLFTSVARLSDLRDSFVPGDDDQSVTPAGTAATLVANINPSDGEGLIYGRLPQHTINAFYMTRAVATSGGFFPAGLNGNLRESVVT